MNIGELLSRDAVLADLKGKTKTDVLTGLVAPLLVLHPELRSVDVVSVLNQREELGSTAVGEGVAIPHGKVPGLSRLLLAVGRSSEDIDFNAPDGQPCRIFFLILVPEHGAGQHLRLLAQIARRAKDPVFRREVLLTETADQLWQTLVAP